MSGFDELEDAMGEAMGRVRRDVEAAVRIPPYELVLRRHHRRRRRAAGAGGVALAALIAVGFAIAPALTSNRMTAVTPTTDVRVSLAPPQGAGTLTLADVSFADASQGALLSRRCTQTCHDVVSATSDGGLNYGAQITVPGTHRYVAVVGDGTELAYAPDIAVSSDRGASWAALAVPAPVADVSVSGGTVLVLLTPTGAPAQLWSGPVNATTWSAYTSLGSVTGSNDTARLLRPTATSVIVVSGGGDVPQVATATLSGSAQLEWSSRDLALCGAGALPSVSAVSAETWWVACEGQQDGNGAETLAVTTDAGQTFTSAPPPVGSGTDQQVTALSASTAYLSGGPALLKTNSGGQMWVTALKETGLATPHIPAGVGGVDVWVVQPGTSTVWRTTGSGWAGLQLR